MFSAENLTEAVNYVRCIFQMFGIDLRGDKTGELQTEHC